MPRRCSICTHAARTAIDRALAGGAAFPEVAAEWNVSAHAVGRHFRADHITKRVVKSAAAVEIVEADDLLAKVRTLEEDARRIGATAEQAGDLRTALAAVRELTRIVDLLGRLAGVIRAGGNVAVAVGVQVTPTPPASPSVEEMAARFEELVHGQAERLKHVPKDGWATPPPRGRGDG